MRLQTFRDLSLGMATASFLFVGAAMAQPLTMTGVNGKLDHGLDSKNAAPGQIISVKIDRSVKTMDGIDLPKGTELMGKVDQVHASENGSPGTLSIVLNEAQMKDGKQVPVKVTLVGAFPPGQHSDSEYGTETMGPAPKHISMQEKVDQEPGVLSHTSMTSSVKSHDSAVFRKDNGDVNLKAGTYFQLGIAPASQNGLNQGAE